MLRGRLDLATRTRLTGWAQDDRLPNQPVALLVIDNDTLLDRIIANVPRPDLAASGIGTGHHGFDIRLESGLPGLGQHLIRVVRERDGAELPGSPALIAPAHAFDAHEASLLQSLLDGLATTEAIDTAIATLARQIDRLAARRPETLSNAQSPSRRALIIDTTMPAPGRDAGSNAILSHAAALTRLGFAVSLIAADASAPPTLVPTLAPPAIDFHAAPITPTVETLLRREANAFDLVYLHRLDAAAAYMPLVRLHQPRARIVYSVADLHHIRLARRGFVEREASLIARARKVRDTEFALAAAADAVITHSHAEAALLRRHLPAEKIHIVPWAIEAAKPRRRTPRNRLGFIGHFGHAPNLDAAHRLIHHIMPLLRAADPDIECLIAGSAMPAALRDHRSERVTICGKVDDLPAFLASLTLTIAPMTFGAGVKGKILDSLAAGVPCIATPTAIEGLDWPETLAPCIATDNESLTTAILALCDNPQAHRRTATAGLDLIRTRWSEPATDAALARIVGERRERETRTSVWKKGGSAAKLT